MRRRLQLMRRMSMLIVVAVLFVFPARAQAKGNTTTPPPGACRVTLRNLEGDVIRSDGGGDYVNGVDGVTCNVVQDPTRVNYGWLGLGFSSSKSKRYIVYMGQATDVDGGPGYSSFNSRGSFEVKGMAKIQYNIADPTYYDIEPFRANVEIGQFNGDSNYTSGLTGSASVFVQPLDSLGCSWYVWSDPSAGSFISPTGLGDKVGTRDPRVIELRKQQGISWITQGLYPMPFGATVKLIEKPECK